MADELLTMEKLASAPSVLTLGALVVNTLQEHRVVTLYVNRDGVVQLCPPGEIQLDGLPENEAIQILSSSGYSDEQLIAYLKGRDDRKR